MASVDIKILTMESQTYTIGVDKNVPVPTLKEQIAQVTGVVSDHQHLLCRGKLLTDDKNLSAYHVEDGHTLHLVVRQPVDPSPVSSVYPDLRLLINDRISAGDSSDQPEDISPEISDISESNGDLETMADSIDIVNQTTGDIVHATFLEQGCTMLMMYITTNHPQLGIPEMRSPRRRRREDDDAFVQQPEAQRRRRFSL